MSSTKTANKKARRYSCYSATLSSGALVRVVALDEQDARSLVLGAVRRSKFKWQDDARITRVRELARLPPGPRRMVYESVGITIGTAVRIYAAHEKRVRAGLIGSSRASSNPAAWTKSSTAPRKAGPFGQRRRRRGR
jgi:hypothetical protein